MVTYYVGADVDCKMTELVVQRGQDVVMRDRVPTDIRSLRNFLENVPRRKVMLIEECGLAGWLYRNLCPHVDRFIVTDPRRNRAVYDDGDKTDPLDALELAALGRGGYVREVYHTLDEGRLSLKEAVALYHDRVREAVRQVNKLKAACRAQGLRVSARLLDDRRRRRQWLQEVQAQDAALAGRLAILWVGLDAALRQSKMARADMVRRSAAYPIIQYWQEIPGFGPIRSTTLFAYLDTPWRFQTPKKLWKYCGVGLKRTASGTDKHGRPNTGSLRLFRNVNKKLKAAIQGAALTAIRQGGNPFADRYDRMVRDGVAPSNARHAVARRQLSVMQGMWKTNSRYDPSLA